MLPTIRSNGYGPQGGDLTPCIWINTGRYNVRSAYRWLSLHPGPGTEPSILRWTAPVVGKVHVTGQFLAGDGGIMTIAYSIMFKNCGRHLMPANSILNIVVAAGDNIDFAVYGGYGYGNTPISATISYGN